MVFFVVCVLVCIFFRVDSVLLLLLFDYVVWMDVRFEWVFLRFDFVWSLV